MADDIQTSGGATPPEASGGTPASSESSSKDIFADERVRKMQSALQREKAEAEKRAQEAERQAARVKAQIEALISQIGRLDADEGARIAEQAAREAELTALREWYTTYEAERQAESQRQEWQSWWERDLESMGLNPYDPRIQRAMSEGTNEAMQQIRKQMLDERTSPPAQPPAATPGQQITQRTQSGAFTTLPEGGQSAPGGPQVQAAAAELADRLTRTTGDARARLIADYRREHGDAAIKLAQEIYQTRRGR
jgi:hypothetical protein